MNKYKVLFKENEFKEEHKIVFASSTRDILKKHKNIVNIEKIDKVGLAIMRIQPLHFGHLQLIQKMMNEMDTVIIGIGSIQESNTINNPFTAAQRREMLKKVLKLGNKSNVKILELSDIGTVNKVAWATHVLGVIAGKNLPKPTHYYAGSKHDGSWFESLNTEFGDGFIDVINLNRINSNLMSGTDIRKSLIDGSHDWIDYVPPILIDFIDENFPNSLRMENDINKILEDGVMAKAIEKMVKHPNMSEEEIKKIISKF